MISSYYKEAYILKIAKRIIATNNFTHLPYQYHLFKISLNFNSVMNEFSAGAIWYWHWYLGWMFDVNNLNALIAIICIFANSIPFEYRVLAAGTLLVATINLSTGLQIIYCSKLIDFNNEVDTFNLCRMVYGHCTFFSLKIFLISFIVILVDNHKIIFFFLPNNCKLSPTLGSIWTDCPEQHSID